jgi:hypothetical protein
MPASGQQSSAQEGCWALAGMCYSCCLRFVCRSSQLVPCEVEGPDTWRGAAAAVLLTGGLWAGSSLPQHAAHTCPLLAFGLALTLTPKDGERWSERECPPAVNSNVHEPGQQLPAAQPSLRRRPANCMPPTPSRIAGTASAAPAGAVLHVECGRRAAAGKPGQLAQGRAGIAA